MTTGRLAFIAILVLLIYWVPRWMPQPAAAADSDRTSVARILAETVTASERSPTGSPESTQRTIREAERRLGPLTADQRALLEELKTSRDAKRKNAAMENLAQTVELRKKQSASFYDWAAEVMASVQETYRLFQPKAQSALWFVAILLVGVGLAGALLSQMRLARLSARLGFRLSRGWLVILSFVSMAIAMGTRTNPWTSFPPELVLPPVVALIGCAFALRMVDMNYPIWNSLVRGCGAPLVSMAFIATYLNLV